MSDKTYVFDSGAGNNNVSSMLPALLQNKGVDPAYLMGMMNNGGGFGNFGINEIIALVVIAAIFGGGNGNGIFGGGGNNRNADTELIMQTLNRNGVDIGQLAQAVNCSTDQILGGINQVSLAICNLGNQMGQNTNQILTSIMQGNNALTSQICSCCCDIKQILSQGFSSVAYETQRQTCDIQKSIQDSTAQILAGQRAAEMREMQDKLDALREKNTQKDNVINNYQQTQVFGQMLSPLSTAIGNLQSDIDGIKCRLPKTEVITAQPDYVPINRGINMNYALQPTCGYGFPYGNYPYGFPYGFPNGNNGSFF